MSNLKVKVALLSNSTLGSDAHPHYKSKGPTLSKDISLVKWPSWPKPKLVERCYLPSVTYFYVVPVYLSVSTYCTFKVLGWQDLGKSQESCSNRDLNHRPANLQADKQTVFIHWDCSPLMTNYWFIFCCCYGISGFQLPKNCREVLN